MKKNTRITMMSVLPKRGCAFFGAREVNRIGLGLWQKAIILKLDRQAASMAVAILWALAPHRGRSRSRLANVASCY
jgi:hypothetical protein